MSIHLSGPFTAVPNRNFWNTGRKKLSSRSKTYEIWSNWIRSGGIQKNSKSKTPSADSDLEPRCEASGKTIVLPNWDLVSRLEMKLEIPRVGEEESGWQEVCDSQPCLKTNIGTSVNALPNFSTKMGGKKKRS
ncbi:hypothetical protein AVEN_239544-1 [Araneus ventricosus]|uniref:Uncharacterized protein n=1 Tax=Araneus ventricosus TaxID=182803 RepID=A0A4Y2HLQ9_ARAVE|nr:hypothetical protein AVEN_239544-1 [Araneus ventricosus]